MDEEKVTSETAENGTEETAAGQEQTHTAAEENNIEETANDSEQQETEVNTESENENDLLNQNMSLAAENASLREELTLLRLKIKDEFREDAMTLAKPLINDDCDLQQALTSVIEKYPQFVQKPTPTLNLGGSTQGIRATGNNNDAFVAGIKNNFLGR